MIKLVNEKEIIASIAKSKRWLIDALKTKEDQYVQTFAFPILALIAAGENPYSKLIQNLTKSLTRVQSTNGSWNNNLYDTVCAVIALNEMGMDTTNPTIVGALEYLKQMKDERHYNWYESFFDTVFVTIALLKLRVEEEYDFLRKVMKWILSKQSEDGSWFGPYTTAFVISLLVMAQDILNEDYTSYIKTGIKYLKGEIEKWRSWGHDCWTNSWPIKALVDVGFDLHDKAVMKAVEWFLSNQDISGRWPAEPPVDEHACATFALSKLVKTKLPPFIMPMKARVSLSSVDGKYVLLLDSPEAGLIRHKEELKIDEKIKSDLVNDFKKVSDVASYWSLARRGERIEKPPETNLNLLELIKELGQFACTYLLPQRILSSLESENVDHLLLDLDETLLDIPWELMHDGEDFLGTKYAVGRGILSEVRPKRKSKPISGKIRLLLVGDPTEQLTEAHREIDEIERVLAKRENILIDSFFGKEINKRDFLLKIRSEKYDIVHFAGHAEFNRKNFDESYLRFHHERAYAYEINRFMQKAPPSLVFVNACSSAVGKISVTSFEKDIVGLANSFIQNGVSGYIGALWPIHDVAAATFSIDFYENLFRGYTLGEALRISKVKAMHEGGDKEIAWASFILYGDPALQPIKM